MLWCAKTKAFPHKVHQVPIKIPLGCQPQIQIQLSYTENRAFSAYIDCYSIEPHPASLLRRSSSQIMGHVVVCWSWNKNIFCAPSQDFVGKKRWIGVPSPAQFLSILIVKVRLQICAPEHFPSKSDAKRYLFMQIPQNVIYNPVSLFGSMPKKSTNPTQWLLLTFFLFHISLKNSDLTVLLPCYSFLILFVFFPLSF